MHREEGYIIETLTRCVEETEEVSPKAVVDPEQTSGAVPVLGGWQAFYGESQTNQHGR